MTMESDSFIEITRKASEVVDELSPFLTEVRSTQRAGAMVAVTLARRAGLTLRAADQIATGAIATAQRNGFKPITATVVDPAGNTIVQKRMDGCSPAAFPAFSFAKAFTCVVTGLSSRGFRDKYTGDGAGPDKYCQMVSMVNITDGKMAPFPGGVLLKDDSGILGAVGISGASSDEDEYCALEGVKSSRAEGLLECVTEPAEHSCKTVREPQ